MGQQELAPISSLTTDQLIAKESALEKYAGDDKVVLASALAQKFLNEPKKSYSFSTGMGRLDALLGNLETGELIAIGGPTKNGKTTLAQTWTLNLGSNGIRCLWFSFEVPMRQFLQQIGSMGDLGPDFDFCTPQTLKLSDKNWLRDRIIESKLKHNSRVIFIDNLHHLLDFANLKNVSLDLGVVIRDLKRMAVELNVVIAVLCHSKKGENAEGVQKEVSQWDIRDSGFITQESDATIMVQRKQDGQRRYSTQAIVKLCNHRRTGKMDEIVHVIRTNHGLEEDEQYYSQVPE